MICHVMSSGYILWMCMCVQISYWGFPFFVFLFRAHLCAIVAHENFHAGRSGYHLYGEKISLLNLILLFFYFFIVS